MALICLVCKEFLGKEQTIMSTRINSSSGVMRGKKMRNVPNLGGLGSEKTQSKSWLIYLIKILDENVKVAPPSYQNKDYVWL